MEGGRVKDVAWFYNRPKYPSTPTSTDGPWKPDDWFLLPDDNNGTLHWVDPHDTTPMPMVAESDVTFLLYTRQNPSNPTTIQTGVASSLGNFNANRQTKFVIHGWNSNGNSMATVRNGYVNSGLDLNIIVVDWQGPANQGYAQSMTNTRAVGVFVANHINWLVSRGLSLNNINIVGFSLGAHVAGIAGHNVHGTVGRITVTPKEDNLTSDNTSDSNLKSEWPEIWTAAIWDEKEKNLTVDLCLDPAGPLYINVAPEHHLDAGDAAHVQCQRFLLPEDKRCQSICSGLKTSGNQALNLLETSGNQALNLLKTSGNQALNLLETSIKHILNQIKTSVHHVLNLLKTSINHILNQLKTSVHHVLYILVAGLWTVLVARECQGASILGVFPFPAKSMMILFTSLMEELATRGHQVTVMSSFPRDEPLENYTDIVLPNSFTEKGAMYHFGARPHGTLHLYTASKVINKVSDTVLAAPDVQRFIHSQDLHFDIVVVHDVAHMAFLGLAHKFDAPIIRIVNFAGYEWTFLEQGNPSVVSYNPHYLTGIEGEMSFWERAENAYMFLYELLLMDYFYVPVQEAIMRKHFGASVPSVSKLNRNTALILWCVDDVLSHHRPLLPNVIRVGGMHIKKPKKLPQDLQKFMDDALHGVIYMSLGTNLPSAYLPSEKIAAFIEIFAQLKQKVLWKWENGTLPGRPPNVKVAKWFPQQDILGA
uniref:Lipase domain-containing protein n=1 Tax=Timema genevievae TaxID=629358 RepID=A0A7R9JND2_TIMGE|nr:unnamed protein product [Timema genevievae]